MLPPVTPATAGSVSDQAQGFLPWTELRNPIYSHPGWSVKDPAVTYREGWFYLFFSAFFFDDGQERCHVVAVKTQDLQRYSDALFALSGKEQGWLGACSPGLARIGERYYLTYNSWGDKHGQPNQLFYGVSDDLETWTFGQALATELTRGKRAIDGALRFHDRRFYLIWKEWQTPQIAWAESLDGEWHRLGRPGSSWFENGEIVDINGVVYLLVTGLRHEPYWMQLLGDPGHPAGWLDWSRPRRLEIPAEGFNASHRANAAFLVDWRRYDGHFYLFYAGRTEGRSHAGRGDSRLGVARSRDMVGWQVPGSGPDVERDP
jgi:hypothetical protein